METQNGFLRTMLYLPVDRVPDIEFGYWPQTIKRWHTEGFPANLEEVYFSQQHDSYFEMDCWPVFAIPTQYSLNPPFEEKVLEEDERIRIVQGVDGVVSRQFKSGREESSIPQFISFPIKTLDDFKRLKEERLRLDDPVRLTNPKAWNECRRKLQNPECIITFWAGTLYGGCRSLMGVENLSVAFHEEPKLIEAMMNHFAELTLHALKQVPRDIPIHYISWWEDMCFRSGPLISPGMFREFMVPYYKKVMNAATEYGCRLAQVDCDGSIHQLIGLWLESGINVMMPLEIGGGTDPFWIRKEFGRQVRLMGGVDKKEIAKGKKAIDKELERIAPLIEDGGYIPHMDHLVPPDISLEDYWYYRRQKRKLLEQVRPMREIKHGIASSA